MNKIIIFILAVGLLYRLFLTANGNFLFNMDNARDMVDVREMVVLGKLRLTGPTSAIEGLFNGPLWYYMLAIPFILTGGNPYGSIVMEIFLWAIGGFFLLKLVGRFGKWLIVPIGLLWVASDYVVLTNLYAFNPNPVILLTPLFIYLLAEYIQRDKGILLVLVFLLAGLFFNLEMNFGVFTPLIILVSLILTKKMALKSRWFWMGAGVFILTILPQIIFDLRHQFIMSKAIIRHLSENQNSGFNFFQTFFDSFSATLMNHKIFTGITLVSLIFALKRNPVVIVAWMLILIPFLGYLILPVTVNSWHLGAEMAAAAVLVGFLIKRFPVFSVFIIFFALSNMVNFFLHDFGKPNMDPSLYKNEIAAIDYVYEYANGKNFKVYTYLPSVYDYPYQYLFWWYGKNKYGYIPGEYVYSSNKPQYIPGQDKFQGSQENFSGLVFLIKEPDRNDTRSGWEG
ncbi:glycosyltransferase family 39 protein, partial [Candidatus Daviesbacteria bacterium]|nr:glycosyltransferase family 39 protein [Candidatus Daviesbacteria bacterium]